MSAGVAGVSPAGVDPPEIGATGFSMAYIDKIIWIIIRYSLLFDTINGFILHGGNDLPISQAFKMLLLTLVAIRLAGTRNIVYIFLIIVYTSVLLVHLSLGQSAGQLGETINHLFKFLSVPIYFIYARFQLKQNPELTFVRIRKAMFTNTLILVGNVWIGLLGLGYAQYGDSIGYRGYFYAGNEVSGVMLMLFPFVLYQVIVKYGMLSIKYVIINLLILITGVLTITKTALLGVVLTVCFIPLIKPGSVSRKRKRWIFALLVLSMPVIGFIFYYGITQSGIIDRWLFFYDRNGLWFLLSGREDRVIGEIVDYLAAGWSGWLLGLGGNRTVETDPFDTLFNYGILGVVFVYGFYIYLLTIARIHRKKRLYAPLIYFCDIMILCASALSGHILFSGMAGIFIALVNSLVFYEGTEKKTLPKHSHLSSV